MSVLTYVHIGVLSSAEPMAAAVYTFGTGRIMALAAGLLGVTGVVVGGRALARSATRMAPASRRARATLSIATGLLAMLLGGLVVATSDGGIGTGNGRGGGYVALVIGLIALVLGALAMNRARRTA